MKLVIEGDQGTIYSDAEKPAFASSVVIEFDATPDNTLEAIDYFNDQKIKLASNEAAESDK